MANLSALQQSLGVCFKDTSLLEQALVHSSYINENPGLASTSNERLEFLGDAVLSLTVAEKLYQDFPHFTEGTMTKLRAALVRRDTLARMARSIGLGDYLYLGKGEEASNGRHKAANLAGVLEAVMGAVFLDRGLAVVKNFIVGLLDKELHEVITEGIRADYKSQVQELIQAQGQPTPTYHVIETTGPEHDKRFTVEIKVGDTTLGKGSGKSKKTAESEAARSALEQLARR